MGFLEQKEIESIGFKYAGKNLKLSDKAVFYNPSRIEIGDNSRIDDFCVLSAGSGGIKIGNYVHIAIYCSIVGQGNITIEDFAGLSSRVSIYSSSDDYSGEYMTNPCVPNEFTNVISGDVLLKKHVIVGVNSVILPNVQIGLGSAIGAFSLVNRTVEDGVIVAGTPIKLIKARKSNLLNLETKLINS